nr:MAG TPA: hypothetical protein [Caudoviricetes sp.]
MTKKLKLAFWLTDKTLSMKIEEQAGLPHFKETGFVRIKSSPYLEDWGIYLRGKYWAAGNQVVSKCFISNEERDAYLHKVINAITDELFTGEGELKIGEMCEVKDDDSERWKKRKLLAILPEKYDARFIVESGDCPTEHSSWDCARPIAKHTEPTVEECGNVVTYIWEK